MTEPIVETTGTTPETLNNEPLQTPLEQEIERETKRTEGRTEAEKAAFSLKKNAERAKELGIDPAEVLGYTTTPAPTVDKDAPLTVGMYEQMQKNQSQQTSIQLAERITDPHERELTITYLKTRIVPSGDPEDDLRFARQAVNSVKNGQIVEELSRATPPRTHGSGAGAPPNPTAKPLELTAEEQQFTRAPFNMTPAEIIAARTQS
jgi:hypothetical protein